MNTTLEQRLADALRPMAECLHDGITLGIHPGTPQAIAIREALAAYDAQQVATPAPGTLSDTGKQTLETLFRELQLGTTFRPNDVRHAWAHARMCIDAHDGLVAALLKVANLQAFAMTDGRGMQGDNAKELNRIIGAALASAGEATP